jgi:hypothetical protein
MKEAIQQLEEIISTYANRLARISEGEFSKKLSPEKWNKKEELGHLIDSAHNNLRRFIAGQYETNAKIVYDQNFWVQAANYKDQHSTNLVVLWRLLNTEICEVLKKMPENNFKKTVDTGKETIELRSLEWLAADYVKHAQHHLHHILELDAVPY